MQVYSPTQTNEFAFCPQSRAFYKEGWQARIAGKATIASWMGVAMAVGLEAYYKGEKDLCVQMGMGTWLSQIEKHREAGGGVEDSDLVTYHNAINRALETFENIDPIPAMEGWKVRSVEHQFKEAGDARVDLLVDTPQGLTNVDYKWKNKVYVPHGGTIATARGKALADYDNYWNMLHYQWALQREAGDQRVNPYYYIALGELAPKPRVTLQAFEVTPPQILKWTNTAMKLWKRMEVDDPNPEGNTTHANKYGPCKYYNACFTHFGDRESMKGEYIRVERAK